MKEKISKLLFYFLPIWLFISLINISWETVTYFLPLIIKGDLDIKTLFFTAINLGLLIFNIFILYYFFTRNKLFIKATIFYLIIINLILIFNLSIQAGNSVTNSFLVRLVTRSIFMSVIYVFFLLKSKIIRKEFKFLKKTYCCSKCNNSVEENLKCKKCGYQPGTKTQ